MGDKVYKVDPILVHLGYPHFEDGDRLYEDLGMDSLDHVELQMAIEEELGVDLEDWAFDNIMTVRQLREFVEGKYEQTR